MGGKGLRAMRVFRFLQARPFWLYKLGAVLGVAAFVLTVIYGWGQQAEVMIYPLILFVLPTSINGLFSIALLASLGEVVIDLTRQPHGSLLGHLGLAFLITMSFSLGLALFEPGLPALEHVSTVQYNDHELAALATGCVLCAVWWYSAVSSQRM